MSRIRASRASRSRSICSSAAAPRESHASAPVQDRRPSTISAERGGTRGYRADLFDGRRRPHLLQPTPDRLRLRIQRIAVHQGRDDSADDVGPRQAVLDCQHGGRDEALVHGELAQRVPHDANDFVAQFGDLAAPAQIQLVLPNRVLRKNRASREPLRPFPRARAQNGAGDHGIRHRLVHVAVSAMVAHVAAHGVAAVVNQELSFQARGLVF